MSSDAFDTRRKAAEEAFFEKQNAEAMKRLGARDGGDKPRLSPITGKPMEQITIQGIVVDRCVDSGGIWLDNGELDQIMESAKQSESGSGWFAGFVKSLRSE
jgi:hypothetical protein